MIVFTGDIDNGMFNGVSGRWVAMEWGGFY